MGRWVVQMGHVPRTSGSTGTSGHRGTEQEFARRVAAEIQARYPSVIVIGADDPCPPCDVFTSLHQDGSTNPRARGASIGFPPGSRESAEFGATFKALYAFAGWPDGFRRDNYTSALSGYYMWDRVTAPRRLLVEHGFATNREDDDWMWDNIGRIADVHVAAFRSVFPAPTRKVNRMDVWAYINAAYAEAGQPVGADGPGRRYWFKRAISDPNPAGVLTEMERLLGLAV